MDCWPTVAELPLTIEALDYGQLDPGRGSARRIRAGSYASPATATRGSARTSRCSWTSARRSSRLPGGGRSGILRAPRRRRAVALAAGVGDGAALAQLGLRVGRAGPRARPGGTRAARRHRARAAAGHLREFARPRRAGVGGHDPAPAGALPEPALQARRGGHVDTGDRRRTGRDRRRAHDRLQGPVRPGGRGRSRARRPLRAAARAVPGRADRGSARPARDRRARRAACRPCVLRRANPHASPTSTPSRSRPGRST